MFAAEAQQIAKCEMLINAGALLDVTNKVLPNNRFTPPCLNSINYFS